MVEIPKDEEGLLIYGENTIVTAKKYLEFLGLDAAKIAELEELDKTFRILHVKCKTPEHTRMDTELKKKTKTSFLEKLRAFIKVLQANPKMDDVLRTEFNITKADEPPAPTPKPVNGPASKVKLDADSPGKVIIDYLWKKPAGALLVEIGYLVSDAAAIDHEQLTQRETFSHNPWVKIFADALKGKRLSFALRYLTTDGHSNWSEIKVLIIP
jgi:hypothetical protein